MKKEELERVNKSLTDQVKGLTDSIEALLEESLMLGEDMRGRPFLPEDIDGFESTDIMNEFNTHVERELYSLDNFHISRGRDNIWFIITPTNITVPVEINDMFEGIMILRALGLKRLTFQGLMEADDLVNIMFEDIAEITQMRDDRVAKEIRILNETKR